MGKKKVVLQKNNTMAEDLRDERVPMCLYWSADQAARWLSELGFPQYAECITFNNINGRRLIELDASALPKIGIHDFDHIKKIAKAIRGLLGTEEPDYRRSITLAPREDLGMYLEYKSRSGTSIELTTYKTFVHKYGDAFWEPPRTNIADLLRCKNT